MEKTKKCILTLKDVCHHYKGRVGFFNNFVHKALNGVTLELFEGESIGIIGRNGCGKSTLLKVMAGLIDPTSGVVLCDESVTRSLLSLGVGFLPELSGQDNAILSAMLLGKSKAEAMNAIPDIYVFSELGEFFNRPVKSYSAGMKARLGFSTALLINVDILLIDEILGVGDVHFRKKAEKAMKKKINSQQTIVFVSHNAKQVSKLCERSIWLKDGVVFLEGETALVVDKYNEYMG